MQNTSIYKEPLGPALTLVFLTFMNRISFRKVTSKLVQGTVPVAGPALTLVLLTFITPTFL